MQEPERTNTAHPKKRTALILIGFVLLVSILYVYVFRPTITGLAVLTKEVLYNESLYLTFNENSEHEWFLTNPGELKSLSLTGSLTKGAKAEVFVEYDTSIYMIFDSTKLSEGDLSAITGSTVSEEPTGTEPIILSLKYGEDSVYDENNDGIETLTGVIDFALDTSFNRDISYDKLCTKWDVYSLESETSTIACYGNSECCSLLDLAPENPVWNETLYLNYEKYGATANNKITAQVIYANYSLDPENPYSDIEYSNYDELDARFLPESIDFSNVCIETCLLPGADSASYRLIVNVSNGSLNIDSVGYSILTTVPNTAPILAKNISTVSINKNENLTIDLSDYFTDNDELVYTHYDVENIEVIINGNIATLVPDNDFIGKRYSFFTANDSLLTTVSDVFTIDVIEKIITKFIVKSPSGADVASIDEKGDMYFIGSLYENQAELNPEKDSFIVKNENNNPVAYFTQSGDLFLKGTLTQAAVMSVTGYNLEIRTPDDALVAFFDDQGNLKIKGSIT